MSGVLIRNMLRDGCATLLRSGSWRQGGDRETDNDPGQGDHQAPTRPPESTAAADARRPWRVAGKLTLEPAVGSHDRLLPRQADHAAREARILMFEHDHAAASASPNPEPVRVLVRVAESDLRLATRRTRISHPCPTIYAAACRRTATILAENPSDDSRTG